MTKLIDLVRDFRRRSATSEEDITMEVIDRDGAHIGGSARRATAHIRVITGVPRTPGDR